ncbi:MAG: YbaY family lipoprotein [Dehalococcoidales bacterium]|nr:YbaY family lipoprotein [Dehalococcoidales bacterium]
MKKIILLFGTMLLIGVSIFSLACSSNTDTKASVKGVITYRERIALPQDNVKIIVKIEDISLADAKATTIGEQLIENPGHQVPFDFSVEYDPADIVENHSYAMRVRIEVGGDLWFTNTSSIPVITRDNPVNDLEIVLSKVN